MTKTMKQTTIQPKIKQRQIEILLLLYRFRYLNRAHIQAILEHKSRSKILEWLNDLAENGYIECEYDRKVSSSPSVYSLAPKSRLILKGNPAVKPRLLGHIWRDKTYSAEFRDHCLFLGDIYLSLIALTERIGAELHYYTKPDLHGMKHLIVPTPDTYFSIEEKSGKMKRYFLELFDDLPPRFLRTRINHYFKYHDSDQWQDNTDKPLPEIIIVCPNERIRSHLKYYIQSKLEEDSDLSFYLTTRDIIKTEGLSSKALQRVIKPNVV